MKRFCAFMLVGCMAFSFFGCKKENIEETTTDGATVEITTEATSEVIDKTEDDEVNLDKELFEMIKSSSDVMLDFVHIIGNSIKSMSSKVDKKDGKVKITVSCGDKVSFDEKKEEIDKVIEALNSYYNQYEIDVSMSVNDNKFVFELSEEGYDKIIKGYDTYFSYFKKMNDEITEEDKGDMFSFDNEKISFNFVVPDEFQIKLLRLVDSGIALSSFGNCMYTGTDFSDFKINNISSSDTKLYAYDVDLFCSEIDYLIDERQKEIERRNEYNRRLEESEKEMRELKERERENEEVESELEKSDTQDRDYDRDE